VKVGNKQQGVRLRLVLEPDIAIGPGKADILEGIKETGSIAAAGAWA
jgi:molybdate transport system regulatory protein